MDKGSRKSSTSRSERPTVIVLERPRRVVEREPAPPEPAQPPESARSTKGKISARLRRLHPMD